MSGNTFGQLFRVTTFGESHGPAMGAVIDGCPPLMELMVEDFTTDIDRRRTGKSRFTSQRREADQVEILSGVFEGKTTGTPIALLIRNTDQRSRDYSKIKDLYRPGHADYVYDQKYGIRDYRGGGRSSARETVMRVAAAVIAKKYLREQFGVEFYGYVSQLGELELAAPDPASANDNPFFCADPSRIKDCEEYMHAMIKSGDSIGAELTVVASKVPAGLGSPVFHKLDAEIASALMGIQAVKAVGIGDGHRVVSQKGTQHRDEMRASAESAQPEFLSNSAGGILGGISSGQDIVTTLAIKPTSSLRLSGQTVNAQGENADVITTGRHDPCVGLRAVPIAEAMLALVLMDQVLIQRAQNPGWGR
ncbi:MAG: chorismate synthase [Gammaproteobacteria bacterium]|nr:chorismate synthase [Gammaproteobacteria bacterium]